MKTKQEIRSESAIRRAARRLEFSLTKSRRDGGYFLAKWPNNEGVLYSQAGRTVTLAEVDAYLRREVERAKAVQPEAKRPKAPVAMSERSLRNLATKLGFKLTKLRKTGSYLVQRSDGMVVLGGDEYVGKYIRLEDVARFLGEKQPRRRSYSVKL